jgi:sec-independent protein translocase protein TatC
MAAPRDDFETTRMTLGGHLEELRKRLFRSVVVLTVAFIFAWWFKEDLSKYVMRPWTQAVGQVNADLSEHYEKELKAHPDVPRSQYFRTSAPEDHDLRDPVDPRLTALGPGDSFFFALNISMYFAAFFGGPFVLWQLWQFIAAGLYKHEKRLVHVYFPFSAGLFLIGVVFCYVWVLPVGLYFLSSTLPIDQIKPTMTSEKYFDFLSTMCLAMGAIFQLPILMIFLSSLGIIDPSTYSKYRPHFLVIALFIAALVTPGPDWYSQVLMTIPMYILYEIGIVVSRWRARPRRHPDGERR